MRGVLVTRRKYVDGTFVEECDFRCDLDLETLFQGAVMLCDDGGYIVERKRSVWS